MEPRNSRILAYNMATAIGYSFILTVIMAVVSLIVKAFYPPSVFEIAPIIGLIISPVEGIVQLLILAILIAFAFPARSTLEKFSLVRVRKIAIYTGIGYLILSLLPYAFIVPYIQTYVGLVIAYNVLNGAVGGFLSTYT